MIMGAIRRKPSKNLLDTCVGLGIVAILQTLSDQLFAAETLVSGASYWVHIENFMVDITDDHRTCILICHTFEKICHKNHLSALLIFQLYNIFMIT